MSEPHRQIDARDALAPTLSLFASTSTLVCCALPALLVSIGAGATLAGLVSAAACARLRRWSAAMLWLSAGLWAIGFFFAFLAADLLL